jgi:predicted TIM-barrel enzyme
MNELIRGYMKCDTETEDEEKLSAMLQDIISLLAYISVKSGLLTDSTFADYTRLTKLFIEMDAVLESGLVTGEVIEAFDEEVRECGSRKNMWNVISKSSEEVPKLLPMLTQIIAILQDSYQDALGKLRALRSKLGIIQLF